MIQWLEYLCVGAAIFFAGTWAFGLIASPANRIGSNIATVVLWWVCLTAWFFGSFSGFHLLWLYLLSLVAPAVLTIRNKSL